MAKGKYAKSEKFYQAVEASKKNVEGLNAQYWNDFEENSGKSEGSLKQYKSAVRRFVEYINKDILNTTITEVEAYLSVFEKEKTKENQKRYVNSFLSYTITKNVEKATEQTSSDIILNLVPSGYRDLFKVLVSK